MSDNLNADSDLIYLGAWTGCFSCGRWARSGEFQHGHGCPWARRFGEMVRTPVSDARQPLELEHADGRWDRLRRRWAGKHAEAAA